MKLPNLSSCTSSWNYLQLRNNQFTTQPSLPPNLTKLNKSQLTNKHYRSGYLRAEYIVAMSRRPPNPAAERAAQNQQTIKSLLKLESNKICADCKRNKRKAPSIIYTSSQSGLTEHDDRSAMGKLELRRLYLHSLLRHPPRNGHPYLTSEIS